MLKVLHREVNLCLVELVCSVCAAPGVQRWSCCVDRIETFLNVFVCTMFPPQQDRDNRHQVFDWLPINHGIVMIDAKGE